MKLENKKVLITGGSTGIGKAIVMEFVKHGVKYVSDLSRSWGRGFL